ncbi:bifunctional uroporphyrinogen-III C-methyltransferase/uroporphyrinogen-III synthase [Spongiactinospora sp. TRM90649]|uniref:uroporphyrinogen-III synthase n=1 Tax=Spongiactinospora sp. TRM90649 TaxID=3031114 RepID=UPI0023F8FCBB|nr:bifunctional uroporphyrinogen-III C-methyltransferase/uroporphyrinogen-III synthase [Spongiactinospora sp. TRM90649]MDF5754944.1 bifunctional uroporphyrinogen-III C-methyltransferase/uroporphyrinogen-III synthase [Spongiactinospora sp. TRM90649]
MSSASPTSPTPPPFVEHPGGFVAFVGAGPGDENLLTLRGATLLGKADVVVLDQSAHGALLRHARPDVEVIDVSAGGAVPLSAVQAAKGGRNVVRLCPGDPMFFASITDEAAACAKGDVDFEIVPGVPPATAVLAYAGIPATTGPEFRVVDAEQVDDWSAHADTAGTLVVYNGTGEAVAIGKALVAAGRPESTPVAVTGAGTTTEQNTVVTTLGRLGPDLKHAVIDEPSLIVVGDAVRLRDTLSWFETKPLFGWRVLVPRTKEQSGRLSEQLRSYGAVPEEVPTISVEPPRTPQQMDRAIKGLVTGRYEWVAFTSANAVKAVREKFEEYGLDARAFAGLKVAAVGEATARALIEFGVRPDLVPSGQQSAEGLLAEWPPYDSMLDPINRVLLPRADIATESLVAGLTELGWECDDVTAYRTVRAAPPPAPIREAIKGGGFDAVLFTSSSTVRNLVGIAGKPHNVTVIAAIGPQTVRTAEEFGLRVDVMADRPSASALAAALAEYGAKQRQAAVAAGETPRRPSQTRRGARRRAK